MAEDPQMTEEQVKEQFDAILKAVSEETGELKDETIKMLEAEMSKISGDVGSLHKTIAGLSNGEFMEKMKKDMVKTFRKAQRESRAEEIDIVAIITCVSAAIIIIAFFGEFLFEKN